MLLGDITEGAGFIAQHTRALNAIRERAQAQAAQEQAWNVARAWKARAEELAADNQILRNDYDKLRDIYMRLAVLAADKGIIHFV